MKSVVCLLLLVSIAYIQIEAAKIGKEPTGNQQKHLAESKNQEKKHSKEAGPKNFKQVGRKNQKQDGPKRNRDQKSQKKEKRIEVGHKIGQEQKHSKNLKPKEMAALSKLGLHLAKHQKQQKKGDALSDILCVLIQLIANLFRIDSLRIFCDVTSLSTISAPSNQTTPFTKNVTEANSTSTTASMLNTTFTKNVVNSVTPTPMPPKTTEVIDGSQPSASSTTLAPNYCTIESCSSATGGMAGNTLCKFSATSIGPTCSSFDQSLSVVSSADIDTILLFSNGKRRTVASGGESRGNPGSQPKASNMRKLMWDYELAKMAQTWAQQCVKDRDTCRDVGRFKVGQNIYISHSMFPPFTSDFFWAINTWADEVQAMPSSYVSSFPSNPPSTIVQYSQLVWAETYLVGCGVSFFYSTDVQPSKPYKTLHVCNYGPAGNVAGQPIYLNGNTGSACPPGTYERNSLCVIPNDPWFF